MSTAGSLIALEINGRNFAITADSSGNIAASSETTSTRTSGGSIANVELKVPRIDDIKVDTTRGEDYEFLRDLNGKEVSVSLTAQNGEVTSSTATVVSVGTRSLKEGTTELMFDPNTDWITT